MIQRSSLVVRAISALIGIGVIAGLALLDSVSGLAGLGLVIAILSTFEYSRLMLAALQPWRLWLFRFVTIGVVTIMIVGPADSFLNFMIVVLSLAVITIAVSREVKDLDQTLAQIGNQLLGVFYCGVLPGFTIALLYLPKGRVWFLGYLTIVFAGDTMAYFTGKTWGRRKLVPEISPHKTLAGSCGGFIGSILAMLLVQIYFLPVLPLGPLLAGAFFTAGFAQAGDIFESLLKRVAHVKDSGTLMPGHGGIMDRVDGVYFAAPVFYLVASHFSTMF